MSAIQDSSLLPPLHPQPNWIPPIQVHPPLLPSTPEPGRIVFTRQLWQRTMPEDPSEHGVSTRSQSQGSLSAFQANTNISRRTSSNVSNRSLRSAPSPTGSSRTPLTPEESPPSRPTRKRGADIVEEEDKEIDNHEATPLHTRASSGDSTAHVCICQPDPKIPRPRNAFILYRQHHQAKVVTQNPGLANPEISKIIGEQWRNQAVEVKAKWKALAEEEKLRHQQQYPDYRYQPKRNGRRSSISSDTPGSAVEKLKCAKCGGRSILTPSTPYTHSSNATSPSTAGLPPSTPSSAPNPVSRTLPFLRDLSLQSPAVRRMRYQNMPPNHHHPEDRDDLGPLSPDMKRRRFNGEQQQHHQPMIHRVMPPRYGAVPAGTPVGPGTPFPFGQAPQQNPQMYVPAHAASASQQPRRESLPGLRGVVSPPGPMGPPPRPGMGYLQHRMSQGHITPDRSLQLPPLQTGVSNGAPSSAKLLPSSQTIDEIIMNMPFEHKLEVLRKIAPPKALDQTAPRGPLIAIEGDDADAVIGLAKWLSDTLQKDGELRVALLNGPDVAQKGRKDDAMVEYHLLVAQWLAKSKAIMRDLEYASNNAAANPTTKMDLATTPTPSREVDENYNDDDDEEEGQEEAENSEEEEEATPTNPSAPPQQINSSNPTTATSSPEKNKKKAKKPSNNMNDTMDIDSTTPSSLTTTPSSHQQHQQKKPISILPLFSLHATNTFACRIPLTDTYAPADHWSWNATQWRGVVGADLTIYLKNGGGGEERNGNVNGAGRMVEQKEGERLFVVVGGRGRVEVEVGGGGGGLGGSAGVDGSTLRRLGFEVGEWVRGFGGEAA